MLGELADKSAWRWVETARTPCYCLLSKKKGNVGLLERAWSCGRLKLECLKPSCCGSAGTGCVYLAFSWSY